MCVELLITAGAENVAPVPIEDAIKEQLPCVSNCMLIGDKRKFLSVLLTLKVKTPFIVDSHLRVWQINSYCPMILRMNAIKDFAE